MNWDEIGKNRLNIDMKIVGSKNVVGLIRYLCLNCRKCEVGNLRWRVVVREKEKNGRKVDLWGLECDEIKVRVVNVYKKKEKEEK